MISRVALATVLTFAAPSLYATTYTIEPDHAQGVFRWDHLGFSNPAGEFSQAKGTIQFDPADPTQASVEVTISLSTLLTGLPELDDVFRSTEFFDTAKYPTATYKSNKVEKGAPAGHLKVSGDLNLHGVTKPVTLDVTVVKIGTNPRTGLPSIGFDASTVLSRSAFGLGAYVPQVGDKIPMRIIIEATEAEAYAKHLKEQAAKQDAKKQ